MIARLNHSGVDVSVVDRLLRVGYRSGGGKGGCRVVNGVLFGVLDFVSSC